jgi:outer membrane lipoprotein-sorting protein
MLRDLFRWYLDNQKKLVMQYDGKYLVIKDNSVTGVYNSDMEALLDAEKKYELGTFLIQKCTPGEGAYTQHFSSRVIFA